MLNTILYLAATLIWGSTWLGIKLQLTQVPPILSVGYRFCLASLILITYCLLTNKKLKFSRHDHLFMALQGITLFGLGYCMSYLATVYLTSGLVAVVFAKAAGPKGRVIVFEPNEENCSRIRNHVQLNEAHNVKLLPLGIGDSKKEDQVFVVRNQESATGSLDEKIQSQMLENGDYKELRINVDTLDGAIDTYELPPPDFIKIDIEEWNSRLCPASTMSAVYRRRRSTMARPTWLAQCQRVICLLN